MIIFSALPEEVKGLPLQNYEVILTGVGKINATRKLTEYIQTQSFLGPVINYGTAGKASDKVEVGKVYSVNEFIQRDMDAISMGFEKYETPFGNYALNVTNDPNGVSCGTGDSFYSYEDTVIAMQADFDIVDMEAYALAKVCKLEKINFRCFKFISDNADESASADWTENCKKGAELFKRKLKDLDLL